MIGAQPLGRGPCSLVTGVRRGRLAEQRQRGSLDQQPERRTIECSGLLQRAGRGAAIVQAPAELVHGDARRIVGERLRQETDFLETGGVLPDLVARLPEDYAGLARLLASTTDIAVCPCEPSS